MVIKYVDSDRRNLLGKSNSGKSFIQKIKNQIRNRQNKKMRENNIYTRQNIKRTTEIKMNVRINIVILTTRRRIDELEITFKKIVAYCARVSNPDNQMNSETSEKLLKYLIREKHWSPFEMVSVCMEIDNY